MLLKIQRSVEMLLMKKRVVVLILFALFLFLIFFRLTRADTLSDGSHYSLRALGYVDYILPYNQTTPIQWFGYIPWWGYLSFHDAPPLVFLIQHLFFRVFGEDILILRLPSALAGVGSLILIYFISRRLYGQLAAIFSLCLFGISTFFIWSSRIAYLESTAVFFVLLVLYLFLKTLDNDKYVFCFGIALGCSWLTKYTTFFLLPLFLLFLFFKDERIAKKRKLFLQSFLIALMVFLPVIVYNIQVFRSRRHFDVQFSRILPWVFDAAKRDWPILFEESGGSTKPWENFFDLWENLSVGFTFPLFLFFVVSAVLVSFYGLKKSEEGEMLILPSVLVLLTALFIFIGPSIRYLPLFTPFLAMAGGWAIAQTAERLKYRLFPLGVVFGIFFFMAGYELVYNWNTNHRILPTESPLESRLPLREKNIGFNQLEAYLKTTWETLPTYTSFPKNISHLQDLIFPWDQLEGNNLYLFDSDLNWFATIWYFSRQFSYHRVLILSDADFINQIGTETNLFTFLQERGVKSVFYIVGRVDAAYRPEYWSDQRKRQYVSFLEGKFSEYQKLFGGEKKDIKNLAGETAFSVYRVDLR